MKTPQPCPAGNFCANYMTQKAAICQAGHFCPSTGLREQQRCPAGRFSGDGQLDCSACEPGKFNSQIAQCDWCSNGTFSSSLASTNCSECLTFVTPDRDKCGRNTGPAGNKSSQSSYSAM